MTRRHHYLAGIIQQLSKDEGTRQPSPDRWLMEQDEMAMRRQANGSSNGVHYQSSEPGADGTKDSEKEPADFEKERRQRL